MFGEDFALFFIVVALILGLGGVIFIQDSKNKLHRSFLIFSIVMAIWVISNYMEDAVPEHALKLLLIRIDFISTIFMAYAFFNFCLNFSNKYILIKRISLYKIPLLATSIVLSVWLYFSNEIIEKIDFLPGVMNPVYGSLYPSYLFYIIFLTSIGIYFLLVKYKREEPSDRKQTLLIIAGFILMIIAIIITNVILSIYFDNSPNFLFYSRLGVYSVLILIGFMSYAIARNNFLNIRIITAQLFASAIVLVFFFEILSSQSPQTAFLRIILLLLVLYFARMIVTSVKLEVKRKEELEIANREINERKEQLQVMSDKLAQSNDQLRTLDSAKSEFISIASHQLRTPPTAIRGYASLILEGSYGPISSQLQDAINKIYVANDRQISFVEDLLNVSRIESGRMGYTFDKWKIEDLCQEAIDTLIFKAKDKNLYLNYTKPEQPLPELTIDGPKIREVISNFVDNAIKYTLKGGVTLKTELCKTNSEVCLQNPHIRVTVSDTGIGVPKEEIPYLFAKFSRGKDISRLNTGGTGLGLYVGKSMIEANGGKTWVESDGQGKGSRFIFELPLEQSKETMDRYSQA